MSSNSRCCGLTLLLLAACGGGEKTAGHDLVLREDLVVLARASGELRAVRSEDLVVPPTQRRLRIARLVDDGKQVEAGEVLAAFDPQELAKDLRDRQSDLGTAQKELKKARLDAQSETERLAVDLERTEVELQKARIRAGRDLEVTAQNEILKARADVRALEVAVLEKSRAAELAGRRHTKNRGSLEARIRKADEAVGLAQAQLAALTLKAPVAGTALVSDTWGGGSMRKFQVGDSAWTGRVVVEIPDLSEMEALLFVEEADSALVRVDQPVHITLDAAPGRVFKGRVKTIAMLAEFLSWNNPAKVFRVIASLDETDPELMRPGLRLQAEIELARHEAVLSVPIGTVEKGNGQTFVTTAAGERREVSLGPRNEQRVMVREGLEEGTALRPAGGGVS